jgi:hypothetical protein
VASDAVAWRARGAGVAAVTRGTGSGGEGSWHGHNSDGSAGCRTMRSQETPELSETDWAGTVALGRA